MQRVRWWRIGVTLFVIALSIISVLPSLPSFYQSMLGYLPRDLQSPGGVAQPIVVDDGIRFDLAALAGRSSDTLNKGYRGLATALRARAAAAGLENVQLNGATSPANDSLNVQSTLLMAYDDPASRSPEQVIDEMHLYGRLPLSLRGWLFPENRIQLGLDLKGGVYLVLELDLDEAQQQILRESQATVRSDLRERYRVNCRETRLEDDTIVVVIKPNTEWGHPGDTRREDAESYLEALDNFDLDLVNDGAPNADGLVEYRLLPDASQLESQQDQALTQVLEVLRNRIDAFGVAEPDIRREPNRPRIIVQLPGAEDSSTAANVVRTMGRLEFHMVKQQNNSPWFGSDEPPTLEEVPSDAEILYDREGRWLVVERRTVVTGSDIVRAGTQAYFADIMVQVKFNRNGRVAFGEATNEHTGELMAIALDGKVVSFPRIKEPILTGEAVISGDFDQAEAEDLARILRAGAFPVGVKIGEERTVGPSLGREAVEHGARAGLIGLGLVLLFMLFYYNVCGVFSAFALIINGLMILAALALFGATLTLPGLAGVVLTVGMAVDANVLINERIKEELRTRKSVSAAINAGYGRVFWTIFDANLTTMLTALVLIQFGTGPIRGFGVTLTIGILTSMFTVLFVNRDLYRLFEGRGRKTLPIYPLIGIRTA